MVSDKVSHVREGSVGSHVVLVHGGEDESAVIGARIFFKGRHGPPAALQACDSNLVS
jgi:hypothetical protein